MHYLFKLTMKLLYRLLLLRRVSQRRCLFTVAVETKKHDVLHDDVHVSRQTSNTSLPVMVEQIKITLQTVRIFQQ